MHLYVDHCGLPDARFSAQRCQGAVVGLVRVRQLTEGVAIGTVDSAGGTGGVTNEVQRVLLESSEEMTTVTKMIGKYALVHTADFFERGA